MLRAGSRLEGAGRGVVTWAPRPLTEGALGWELETGEGEGDMEGEEFWGERRLGERSEPSR